MRGLLLFITDLRKCRGKDEEQKRINEELAKIRKKFNNKKPLKGYDKKKYICKLLFMFLLGYEIDFGYIEAINLLSSNAYSEKQIGYLFLSVVMRNDHNFMLLIVNSLNNDISSDNCIFQNLALQFIANNPSEHIADSLINPVLNILISNEFVDSVRQTASLALLQLLRIKPDFILDDFKANRIIHLLSANNLGVVTAATSLIDYLAKAFTQQFLPCLPHCISRLNKIVNASHFEFLDYNYYCNILPWLTIQLLRILQKFPAPTDLAQRVRLKESLDIILDRTQEQSKSKKVQYNNAKYAIIFEATSLIIQMELDPSLLLRATNILGKSLEQKDPNIRFMAIDMMIQLSDSEICLANVKAQWKCILNALEVEVDISIKKRAINLLYIICDETNLQAIVKEMLHFIQYENDYSLETVLKAAALAERFGTNLKWYVDTIFHILQICGDITDDSMWYTLVKIITKNNLIFKYSAEASFTALHSIPCNDIVVKAAAYILGEFGHLIARNPNSNPENQLKILEEKYPICSLSTKSIILTTYMKFFCVYANLKREIQIIFQREANSRNENVEIQQRSVEYLKLSKIAPRSLLAFVFEEKPPSKKSESAVVTVIKKLKSQGAEVVPVETTSSSMKNLVESKPFSKLASITEFSDTGENPIIKMDADVSQTNNSSLLITFSEEKSALDDFNSLSPAVTTVLSSLSINSPANNTLIHKFLYIEEGVLFESPIIRIVVQCKFHQRFGAFHLSYINKLSLPLFDLATEGNFSAIQDKCLISFQPIISKLPVNQPVEQYVRFECISEFSTKPSLKLKFNYRNELKEINLLLPLTLNKFIEPCALNQHVFNAYWQNMEMSGQKIERKFDAKYPMIYTETNKKLKGFHVHVVDSVDPINIYCSGIFYSREEQTHFLIKLERFTEENKYCVSVRSKEISGNLCQIISDLLLQML